MIVIGDRLNATRASVRNALINRDKDFFLNEIKAMQEAGVDFIDLNTAHSPEQELEDMLWLIELIKDNFKISLSVDSENPKLIGSALKRIKEPGQIINSTTLKPKQYNQVFPLMLEHQADLVVLLMDDDLIPKDTEERLKLVEKLVKILETNKIPQERILVDPLVFALSTDPRNALYVQETIMGIKKNFPDLKTIAALSNISFGLPMRRILNRNFLAMLIPQGLDAVLLDPLDQALMSTFYASLALSGKDEFCLNYLSAFRKNRLKE